MTKDQEYDFFQTMWKRGMEESTRQAITEHDLVIIEQFFEDLFNKDAVANAEAQYEEKIDKLNLHIGHLRGFITQLKESRDTWRYAAERAVDEMTNMLRKQKGIGSNLILKEGVDE